MREDLESLRTELKNKIDEVINNYINANDNSILEIPDDNIYMEFDVDNKSYIAFTENSKEDEEFEIMFAKLDLIDGNRILRNIEDTSEYQNVVNEFNRRLALAEGE